LRDDPRKIKVIARAVRAALVKHRVAK
jgi:hypothetical protein